MSLQTPDHAPSAVPSFAIPLSILIAFAIEVAFSVVRVAMPEGYFASEKYFLVITGIYASSALLITMGLGDLVRRLPQRRARGAQTAMIGQAMFLALILAGGLLNLAGTNFGDRIELVWKIQSYGFLAAYLTSAAGLIIAAGGFDRVAAPAIALVVFSVLLAAPPFLARELWDFFGPNYRYVYPLVGVGQLALAMYLIRKAAGWSTRDLPAQPTAPFALLGSALRARVIAMVFLVLFTLFAVGGRSLGAIKVAMVGAPLINMAALIVFAIAALRAGRGLDRKLQLGFNVAGAASAWCAGVLSMQIPALYQMLGGGRESYSSERSAETAQALAIVMPVVATLGVVAALLAVGAHVRRIGHEEIAAAIAPRTTAFVILMLTSVIVQSYLIEKATSRNDLVAIGFIASAAGIAALLVAASTFKRASEATSTTALPTATVLPPSSQ